MKTFTYFWLGNTNLALRDIASRQEYEVRFFAHDKLEGAIEIGLILDNYFGTNTRGPIYFTRESSVEVDTDTMKLFLSEMIEGCNPDEIIIQLPSRLP